MDRKLPAGRLTAAVSLSLIAAGIIISVLYLRGAFLPRWIIWNRERAETIPEGLEEKLDPFWLLQDALCFDIDGDGAEDQILLVWKRGNYGRYMPTWVRYNEAGFSQHVFIYSLREDGWHAIWMSSKLGMEAASFEEGEEIPGTGRKSLDITEADGTVSRWGWLTWGLTRVE